MRNRRVGKACVVLYRSQFNASRIPYNTSWSSSTHKVSPGQQYKHHSICSLNVNPYPSIHEKNSFNPSNFFQITRIDNTLAKIQYSRQSQHLLKNQYLLTFRRNTTSLDTLNMTPLPPPAPLRTKTPSPIPRLSQSKHSHANQKPSRPTSPTLSIKFSISKTSSSIKPKKQPSRPTTPTPSTKSSPSHPSSNNINPKKHPRPRPPPQKLHKPSSSQTITSSPPYIPLANVQARMTKTKVPTTTTRANARAKPQLTLNFGTFLTARISPQSVGFRAGVGYGVEGE